MLDRDRFPVDPWRLVERIYREEDVGVAETLFSVGNGYLGLRGNAEEGREGLEHGTFINGLHETWQIRHAEEAYGFAQVGQTIVNAPDAKIMRLYVDDEPLVLDTAELLEYHRALDFADGVLRRELLWLTPSGKRVRVRSDRLVSFVERHLALMTFEVTVENADAPVVVSCQLLNRQDAEDEFAPSGSATDPSGPGFDPRKAERIQERVLQPSDYWQKGERSALSYRVTDSRMTVAVMADHRIETENPVVGTHSVGPDIAKNVYRVEAKAGVPIRISKVVAYASSRGVPPRELVDRCERLLDRVIETGVGEQYRQQRAWLDAFWQRSDVEIVGRDDLQQAVRWNLFQLAQASARADGLGVPAKGVSGSGYSGHYFWDTEIYVLPFLTYTTPLFARNALRMREHMLPAARKRARQLNENGALFPWRTISGEEASAYYAAGTAQYHINADVTYALAKYVRATGDVDFLARGAVDIVVETARLWSSLGFWRRTGGEATFHIHGVTGPDEYTTVVNDNLFTNVMARFNLRYAAEAVRIVAEERPEAYQRMVERVGFDPAEMDEWERAADAMAIPYADSFGIHPQDSHFLEREVWDLPNTPPDKLPLLLNFHPLVIYRFQVLKQADVVLALFLHSDDFTAGQKRADFDYYDPLTTGDSTLSAVVQAIIAAEIGYRELALDYFEHALFVDLADLHHNTSDGVHVASTGGVWSALVYGFGGLRDVGGILTFDPRLPAAWPELRFRLQWNGASLIVRVRRGEIEFEILSGPSIEVIVRGTRYAVPESVPLIVPLVGQGPYIAGRPSPDRYNVSRREDGSLLTASVPIVADDDYEGLGQSS